MPRPRKTPLPPPDDARLLAPTGHVASPPGNRVLGGLIKDPGRAAPPPDLPDLPGPRRAGAAMSRKGQSR